MKNIKKRICIIFIALFIIFMTFLGILQIKKYHSKLNANKNINIVFTSDAKYTEYTKVTILSAIDTKNEDSIYNINILCVDLPKNKEDEFKALAKDIKNVNIKTIPLKLETLKGIGEFEVTNNVTRADLFKFFIPDIFPELDKILYMDGDILVLHDLSKLYNTDISKKYIGAVKKYEHSVELYKDKDGMYEFGKHYTYNCGVILYNLKKWRQDNIKEKLIEAKNADTVRDLVTQRSFNDIIPLEQIKQLSPIYNTLGRMEPDEFEIYNFRKVYRPYCNNMWSFKDLVKKAVIIHYAGYKKPWRTASVLYSAKWWHYAKMVNPNWEFEPDPTEKK